MLTPVNYTHRQRMVEYKISLHFKIKMTLQKEKMD